MRHAAQTRHVLGAVVFMLFSVIPFREGVAQSVSPEFSKHIQQNADGSKSFSISDRNGIIVGMTYGDPGPVARAQQKEGLFWPDLAEVAMDRMNGDADKADRDIDALKARVRQFDIPYDVELLAYFVDVFAAGNKILHHDLMGWMTAMDGIRQHYQGPLRQSLNMPQLRLLDLDAFEPSVPISDIPSPEAEIAPQNRLPYVKRQFVLKRDAIAPVVYATLNGKDEPMVLSTGSFFGEMPPEMARTGHYRVVGHSDSVADSFDRRLSAKFVVMDTLTLGQSRFHNVLFRVTKTRYLTVGMEFLMQLPKVTMSRDALRFGAEASYSCHMPIHLSMGSDGTRLMIVFPLNSGKTVQYSPFASSLVGVPLFFATTDHFTRSEHQNALLTSEYTDYGLGFYPKIVTPHHTMLYGQKLRGELQTTLVPHGIQTAPTPVSISATLLQSGNVSWDFASRTACFSAK